MPASRLVIAGVRTRGEAAAIALAVPPVSPAAAGLPPAVCSTASSIAMSRWKLSVLAGILA